MGKRIFSLRNMIFQAFLILSLSFFAGMSVNQFRKQKIDLFSEDTSEERFRIDIKDAERLFFSKEAVFVDARPSYYYKKAHIKGAINIPPDKEIRNIRLPKERPIIVYCSEEGCGLSKELVFKLYALGYRNVYYLPDGIKGWKALGLPLESGK